MLSFRYDPSLKIITKATTIKDTKETALDSLRRYNVYSQMIEAYQFVTCHPKMAAIMIGVGICLHMPSIVFYSCSYFNYLAHVYCTVLPNIITLFKLNSLDMAELKPPKGVFIMCTLNLVTCCTSSLCIILCIYLLLPIKGKYLATIRQQHDRRKGYCLFLTVILSLSVCYQISLSLHRSWQFLHNKIEPVHSILLSDAQLSREMARQGIESFWILHAFTHVPCCHSTYPDSDALVKKLPAECCHSYGRSERLTSACVNATHKENLSPSCVSVVINIASDIEVTMDTQMQLFLLISCTIMFVVKYSLNPHLRMACSVCQPTYGWLEMKRPDN